MALHPYGENYTPGERAFMFVVKGIIIVLLLCFFGFIIYKSNGGHWPSITFGHAPDAPASCSSR